MTPGAILSGPGRICLHCGASIPKGAPWNKQFCDNPKCQAAKKQAKLDRWSQVKRERTCIICGKDFCLKPFSKASRRVCYNEDCAQEQRRRAGLASVPFRQGSMAAVRCLRCDNPFRTERVGPTKRPQFRLCSECRRLNSEERWAECWG